MDYQRPGVAETYRAARGLPPATLSQWRQLLRDLVPTTAVRRVADIGCGTGRFVPCLAEAFGASVIGVDPSTRMLAAAARHPRADYAAGAAQALPLADGSVDVVFLSMVWHHVSDAAAAAKELARALSPGGAVVIRTPTVELLDDFAFLRCFPESRALDERRMPSRASLSAAFSATGLTAMAHRTVEQQLSDTPDDYRSRVRQRAFSSLQQISDEAFTRGLARFEAWSASLPPERPVQEPVDVFVFRR